MRPKAPLRIALWQRLVTALAILGPVPAQDAATVLRSHGIEPSVEGVLQFFQSLRPTPTRGMRDELWIERLVDPRYPTRLRAADALRHFGPRVVPALERALSAPGPDPELVHAGTAILEQLRASGERVLLAALSWLERTESSAQVPTEALLAAASLTTSQAAHGRLVDRLAARIDPTATLAELRAIGPADLLPIRLVAIRARVRLLRFADRDTLEQTLDDPAPEVRLLAARAMLARGRRPALATLVELLGTDQASLRARAAVLLQAATGTHRGFRAFDSEEQRTLACAAWQRWLATESATAELNLPLRLAADHLPVTELWVAETGQGVTRFDLDGRELQRIACDPYDVCVSRDGRIAVAERGAGQVRVFDSTGRELQALAEFSAPNDVEFLPNGNLLVVAGQASRVLELNQAGDVVWSIASLKTPFDAQRLPNGNTLVADAGNNRVVEFAPDGSVVWRCAANFPNGVHRTSDGMTYVTNYTGGKVLVFDASGKLAQEHKVGGTVYSPRFADGIIWCADTKRRRIVAIEPTGELREVLRLPRKFHDVEFLADR